MNFFEEKTKNGHGLSEQCVIINGSKYHLPQVFSSKLGYYNLPPLPNGNTILEDEFCNYGITDKDGNILVPFVYRNLKPITGQTDYFVAVLKDGHIRKKMGNLEIIKQLLLQMVQIYLMQNKMK